MFPAGLAHAFIARYTRPGDVVLDPFSGRGTTPLQACAEGRLGVGVDLNPMAALLTAAKVDAPTRADVSARLGQLHLRFLDERAAWQDLADAALAAPGRGGAPVPAAGGGDDPGPAAARGGPGLPSPDAGGAPLPAPRTARPGRAGGPGRPARPVHRRGRAGHPPRAQRDLPVRPDAQLVQHGAALRARVRGPDGLPGRRARHVRLHRGQAAAPLPPGRAAGARRGPAGRRPNRLGAGTSGPAGPRPARPRPTGRDQPALHARREVRLLQLAAAVVPGGRPGGRRRRARRCPPPARVRRLPAPGPGAT